MPQGLRCLYRCENMMREKNVMIGGMQAIKIDSASSKNMQKAPAYAFAILILSILIAPNLFSADDSYSWHDGAGDPGEEQVTHSALNRFSAPTSPADPGGMWYQLTLYALLICLSANTLIYVVGKVLNSQSIIRFAVSEFYQVSASAFLVFGAIILTTGAFSFIAESGIMPIGTVTECYGHEWDVWEDGPSAVLQCKIQEKIEYTEGLYVQAEQVNADLEPLSTLCLYLLGVQIYCWDWNMGLHSTVEKAHLAANKVVPIAINLHAQFMFVDYIANNMLSLFLPLGIILRIFPFLRGLGALLISIAIGFFFVFPITAIILDPDTTRPDPKDLIPDTGVVPVSPCYSSFSGLVDTITQQNPSATTTSQGPDMSQVGKELAKLQTESFVIPLAALAATVLFILTATPILGGDSGEIMHFLAKVI